MDSQLLVKRINEIIDEKVKKEVAKQIKILREQLIREQRLINEQRESVVPQKKEKSTITELLEETRMALRPSPSEDSDRTIRFTSDSAKNYTNMAELMGYGDVQKGNSLPPIVETHNGAVRTETLPPAVKEALTKDYTQLMKKMNELKSKK